MTIQSAYMPWAFIIAGLVTLFVGGEMFVRSAIDVGRRSGLSPLFVGLAIVGFGTSAAELAVSVSAALDGAADIALANVVGSNIANIALVLGLTAAIRLIHVERDSFRRDIPVLIALSLLLLLMLYDDVVSRLEGAILLCLLVSYLILAWYQSRPNSADESKFGNGDEQDTLMSWARILVFLAVGAVLLAAGSQLLVDGAVTVSLQLGISQAVIGATIVAIGTSLPEIVASTFAALRGHTALAVGNIVGSNIWNIVCVLGTTSMISTLPRGGVSWHMLFIMLAVTLILFVVARTGRRVSRVEGVTLLLLYASYQVWLLLLD